MSEAKDQTFDQETEKKEIEKDYQEQIDEETERDDKLAKEIGSVERLDQITDEAEQREQGEKDKDE